MFKDLKTISGLPLSLENGRVVLSGQATSLPVTYRKIGEARPYLKDENANFSSDYLYAMQRKVCLKKDEDTFKKYSLRYDITQIMQGFVGDEFVKTIGHYHKDFSSEVYEVISGDALFLFQKIEPDDEANEIYLISAGVGQEVIIPPGYGHITVNTGKDQLVIADISFDWMEANYDFFKDHRGAAYYIVKSSEISHQALGVANIGDEILVVKNGNYKKIGNLKIGISREIPELGISFSKPLYESFAENPEKFDFIRHPENYKDLLAPSNIFNLENS